MHASTRRRPLVLSIALTAGVLSLIGPGAGSAFAAPPVCTDNSRTVDNTSTLLLDANNNCIDPEGDTMTAALNQGPFGSLSPGAGGVTYTPRPGHVGTDSLTYHVTTPNGDSSNIARTTITVTGTPGPGVPSCMMPSPPPGFPPFATNVFEGQSATFNPFCADPDNSATDLSGSVVDQGSKGDASFNGLSATYAADPGESGPDSFTFKVSDGQGHDSAVYTLNVNVLDFPEGNEPPTCPESHAFVQKNDPVGVRLTGNCVDTDEDPISYLPGSPFVLFGTTCCFLNGNSVIYKPAANFVGEDILRYTAADAYHPPVPFQAKISVLEDIGICCETPDPTPEDPYAASIDSPVPGPIYIDTRAQTDSFPAPTGYTFAGQEYDITTPDAVDPDEPLTFVFKLDGEELADLELDPEDVIIFRNGEAIEDPCPPAGSRSGDWWPCEDDRDTVDGDLWITVLTMESSVYNIGTADVQDADGDGVADEDDNCVDVANPGQEDVDQDGIGAACDTKEKPTSKDDCKKNGWRNFNGIYKFKNEGDCVSFVATGGKNKPKGRRKHRQR